MTTDDEDSGIVVEDVPLATMLVMQELVNTLIRRGAIDGEEFRKAIRKTSTAIKDEGLGDGLAKVLNFYANRMFK